MPETAGPPAAPEPAEPTAASEPAASLPTTDRLPAVYLGHGAPMLIDDLLWPVELAAWAARMPPSPGTVPSRGELSKTGISNIRAASKLKFGNANTGMLKTAASASHERICFAASRAPTTE